MSASFDINVSRLLGAANQWHANPARFARDMALVRAREPSVALAAHLDDARGPTNALVSGPRGVGKSTILRQMAARALTRGVPAKWVLYLPMAIPALADAGLKDLVAGSWGPANSGGRHRFLLIDDVDGLEDWGASLAALSASHAPVTIIATSELKPEAGDGAAAARLNLFNAPPLTFAEYLRLGRLERTLADPFGSSVGLLALNREFGNYLNHGGFPDMAAANGPGRAAQLALDIVDSGTPNVAGIHDTRDLKRTFAYLVGHMGEELAYEGISQALGIAKNTLRKYMDYLERAGLLHRLNRVDLYGKRMERATRFKVYPASPSFYPALFGPVAQADAASARLAEAALYTHFVRPSGMGDNFYARWGASSKEGAAGAAATVSFVAMTGKPMRTTDARLLVWNGGATPSLAALLEFCKANRLDNALAFDGASVADETIDGVSITTRPVSWACYLTSYFFDPAGAATRGPYGLAPVLGG